MQSSILLIDDEAEVLAGLHRVLTGAGFVCHTAMDSNAAILAVRAFAFDLVISDINLGGENGLTLCQQLRLEPGMADTPFMFLSGAQIPDIIRRAHAAGGTYYLRKPFDPQVVLELVDKALWMPHVAGAQLTRV